MNHYEAVIILEPNVTPEKNQEDIQKVKDVIVKYGGVIQSEIKWGKRVMAYSIKKKREGYYLLLNFQAAPEAIKQISQAYRLLETEVLRSMILQKDAPQPAKAA